MDSSTQDLKNTAARLLAGMLANPHIYPQLSDEGASGSLEQKLTLVATEMAENLIQHIESREGNPAR